MKPIKQKTALEELISWGDEMLIKHPQKILGFGEAIDKAEELLEKEKKQNSKLYTVEELKEELIGFQIFLNDKKLITNHDWDYENLAKKYILKTTKK